MAEKSAPAKAMTDEEREKLAKSLDDELDQFIEGLQKSNYKDGWKEETWEKVCWTEKSSMDILLIICLLCCG